MRKSKNTLELINTTIKRLDLLRTEDLENDIARLVRCSKVLRYQFEIQCNGCRLEKFKHETWEAFHARAEQEVIEADMKCEKLINKISEICTKHALHYYIQSDPRGASLYIDIKLIDPATYNNSVCLY